MFGDEVVKDNGDAGAAVFTHVALAILEHHHTSRFFRHVLSRHVNPIVANRAGENLAGPGVLGHSALGHARLALGVGAQRVILRPPARSRQRGNQAHQ